METSTYRIRHKSNPFLSQDQTRSATIYQPDEFTLNQICSLSARAIRVLMIIAAKHDPANGVCHCPKLDMRKYLSMSGANLSHATGELAEAGLLAKAKAIDSYFLNPRAFCPINIAL